MIDCREIDSENGGFSFDGGGVQRGPPNRKPHFKPHLRGD